MYRHARQGLSIIYFHSAHCVLRESALVSNMHTQRITLASTLASRTASCEAGWVLNLPVLTRSH